MMGRCAARVRFGPAAPLAVLLCVGCGDADDLARLDPPPPAPSTVQIEPADLAPSTLTVPVDVSLDLLAGVLEEALPRTLGSLDERTQVADNDRVSIAYELERSPMQIGMDTAGAHVSSTLAYRVRAWYDPPVLPEVSFSCGTNENEPRPRLAVSLRSPLALDRDWRIRSQIDVDRIAPASDADRDRCEVTIFDYDVTGRVVDGARSAISSRSGQIDEMVADVDVRSDFERWWSQIARPIELDDGVWLVIDPTTVGQTGIGADQGDLQTALSLEARPRIVLGARPEARETPLPALATLEQADPGLSIRAEAVATWDEVTRRIRGEVVGERFSVQGRSLRVDDVVVNAVGDGRVSVRVELNGDVRGVVFLVATPTYDVDRDEVHVDDLDFDVRTRDRLVAGAAWVARAGLIPAIRSAAVIDAGPIREWARGQVNRGFNSEISSEVRLEGTAGPVTIEEVIAAPEALRVRTRVTGRARLLVSPGGEDPEGATSGESA